MKSSDTKYIPLSLLVYGLLLFSCFVMIESLISGITWKMVFSIIGFTGFLGLAAIYTKGLYQMCFKKDEAH